MLIKACTSSAVSVEVPHVLHSSVALLRSTDMQLLILLLKTKKQKKHSLPLREFNGSTTIVYTVVNTVVVTFLPVFSSGVKNNAVASSSVAASSSSTSATASHCDVLKALSEAVTLTTPRDSTTGTRGAAAVTTSPPVSYECDLRSHSEYTEQHSISNYHYRAHTCTMLLSTHASNFDVRGVAALRSACAQHKQLQQYSFSSQLQHS
jgi:hypothetical protein